MLVSPDVKYKETYLKGMRELSRDTLTSSREFTVDLEENEKNFETYVFRLRNKEKKEEERLSKYDLAPEEAQTYKAMKSRPGQDWWIMRQDENGEMAFVGAMSIKPTLLEDIDINNGAKEFTNWDGCLGKGKKVGVETSSFLIPSARGQGIIDEARVIFFEELEKMGVDTVIGKVAADNVASNKKQQELVDICGGAVYNRENRQGQLLNFYAIRPNHEKLGGYTEQKKAARQIANYRKTEAKSLTVRASGEKRQPIPLRKGITHE